MEAREPLDIDLAACHRPGRDDADGSVTPTEREPHPRVHGDHHIRAGRGLPVRLVRGQERRRDDRVPDAAGACHQGGDQRRRRRTVRLRVDRHGLACRSGRDLPRHVRRLAVDDDRRAGADCDGRRRTGYDHLARQCRVQGVVVAVGARRVEHVRVALAGGDDRRGERAAVGDDLVRLRIVVRPLDRVAGLDRDARRRERGRGDLDRFGDSGRGRLRSARKHERCGRHHGENDAAH